VIYPGHELAAVDVANFIIYGRAIARCTKRNQEKVFEVSNLDYSQAKAYSLNRLEKELSPKLTYHNLWHTEEDVIPACARIGRHIGISNDEMRLLEIAAAFHDIGYTESFTNHEIVGVRIAVQVLPGYGLSSREIETIMGMIIATRLPQSPRTLLEEILADADLDVLGREDFFPRSEALRQEWTSFGREVELKQWREGQLLLLKSHDYFTPVARMLRNEMKESHIASLEETLRTMK
jgi:uncharacterized protein